MKSIKTLNDEHVEIDGVVYEKHDNENGVMLELELDDDTIEILDNLMKTEGYMSYGETIRAAIREAIKREESAP